MHRRQAGRRRTFTCIRADERLEAGAADRLPSIRTPFPQAAGGGLGPGGCVLSGSGAESSRTLVGVANRHDRLWQRRRRVLNTLVVVLFVFRLVFSKGRPGYATTLAELWGQCRTMGIELPQPAPVSPSSICSARARLNEQLFKTLHQEILKVVFDAEARPRHARKVRPDTDRWWQGHRVFAVDGSFLNLSRGTGA